MNGGCHSLSIGYKKPGAAVINDIDKTAACKCDYRCAADESFARDERARFGDQGGNENAAGGGKQPTTANAIMSA